MCETSVSGAPPTMRSPRGHERHRRSSCPATWTSRTRRGSRRARCTGRRAQPCSAGVYCRRLPSARDHARRPTSVSVMTIQSLKLQSSSLATRLSASQRLVGIRVISLWSRGSWPRVTRELSATRRLRANFEVVRRDHVHQMAASIHDERRCSSEPGHVACEGTSHSVASLCISRPRHIGLAHANVCV